ncbi:MAG TPA: arginase [Flavobacteriales bacterium]|nr:arginase [Flavobacteriales bacterium]
MTEIQLIEVKSEIGAGTRGASMGVDAIKVAALNKHSRFFSRNRSIEIPTENQLLLEDVETPWAKRIKGLSKIYERICEETCKTLQAGKVPIILAGDHSTAGGTIAGIKKAYPNKRLGAVWIDAHADLHSPYTTPSGNIHGMPVATALGMDNLGHKVRDIEGETLTEWEKLKSTGGMSPKMLPEDLVFVALRDYEEEEEALIEKEDIRVIEVDEVRKIGAAATVEKIMHLLAPADIIYISFDVDSLDKNISLGTGTPVEDGLEVDEAKDIIKGLLAHPKAIAFEIVEVNPTLDNKGNKMAEIAFEILKEASNVVMNKQ